MSFGGESKYPPQGAYPPQPGFSVKPQPQQQYYGQTPPTYDQQPYGSSQPQQPPHQNYGSTNEINNNGRFSYVGTGPKYRDLWATLLFLVHFIAFIALSSVGLRDLAANGIRTGNNSTSNGTNVNVTVTTTNAAFNDGTGASNGLELTSQQQNWLFVILAVGILISVGLVVAYVQMMRRNGRTLIKTSFMISIGTYLLLALVSILLQSFIMFILYLLIAGINGLMYYMWRARIPFASELMGTVCEINSKYPGSYRLSFMSLPLQVFYNIWWSVSAVGIFSFFNVQSSGSSSGQFLTVFLVFSLYWTSQVMRNVLHVTFSGVVASYYFLEGTSAMPASPTTGALKRACTTSFGSICYGSLIVALLKTVRYILRSASGSRDSAVACVMDCILGCIEGLIQYFNDYAFVYVAIYGKPFCEAGRETWDLIKSHGIDAIINDSLVGSALGLGAMFVGFVPGGICGLWGYLQFRDVWDIAMGYVILIALAVTVMGFVMFSIVSSVIESGVQTTFVCLAEDPSALARTKPALYQKIQETYPRIQWNY